MHSYPVPDWYYKIKRKTRQTLKWKGGPHSFLAEELIASVTVESILELSQKLEIDQLQDPFL